MFRPLTRSLPLWRRAPRRGGAILLTCFSLITILMVLGLAFMMYAAKEKAVAQSHQEAASAAARTAPDPTDTINRFFSTLIYDVPDDHDPADSATPLLNAMRGHSIARSMYGSRYDFATALWAGSTVPWAGVGTFHDTTDPRTSPQGDRAFQVNYTLMMISGTPYLLDPEWTSARAVLANGPVPAFAGSTAGRSYVGKHAGYTYPDLKNLWLGARDPATGEVLTPSFHRDWLFGTLAPNNAKWRDATGKLFILRPRPLEHPNFPLVAPDADGVYRGDVQNLPGVVGVQKNDSLWMHIGLPQATLSNGRIVQPMVAPLILPLDGSFDQSTHGNQFTPTTLLHSPNGGYGPWGVNIGYALGTYGGTTASPAMPLPAALEADRRELIRNRRVAAYAAPATTPTPRNSYNPYATGQPLSTHAPVAWNGNAVAFALPTGNSISGLPTFTNFQSDNASVPGHPVEYNPNEWLDRSDPFANPSSPVYPYSDLKRLSLRYAFTPDWYLQAFATKTAPTAFLGDQATYPYVPVANATTRSIHRLDPVHARRLLINPKTNSLDRVALVPNFVRRDGTNALALNAGNGPTKPGLLFQAAPAPVYPGPQPRGAITDFAGDNLWVNAQAALGSVNLNRPVADYRTDLTQPLSQTNVLNTAQADADRQQLAKDIFARLVVALGAAAQVTFDPVQGVVITLPQPGVLALPGVPGTFTQSQYDALRYLAQVAVNLVDYIDNDDVNTVFVWNPDPLTGIADFTSATAIGDRVVFGVEKPRLVINEGYSEIVNDPNDPVNGNGNGMGGNLPPVGPAHVRVWVELLNPTSAPNPGTALGDGSVVLNAYRIEMRRADRQTVAAGSRDAAPNTQNDFLFNNPANTTGNFETTAGAPDAVFTFPQTPAANTPGAVGPNNSAYSPAANALPVNGFVLVGPPTVARGDDFAPNGGVWQNKVESGAPTNAPGSGAMGYTMTLPGAGVVTNPEFKRNIVLLRRLANPHLPAGPTNPYVTVDMMDYVPSFDSIHRLTGGGLNRSARGMMNANPAGYDPSGARFAVGKVQPFAGRSVATVPVGAGNHNVYNNNNARTVASTLETSMVRDQTTANGNNQPRHTFGRHNGNAGQLATATVNNPGGVSATLSDTIQLPFDWLVHMDRPLETLGDVFQARDCKPHLLTTEFVVNIPPPSAAPAPPAGLYYDLSAPRWRFLDNGLARGLEYLTVKPPDYRVAHGGRVGGKINVNAMQDRRVAQGLFDPPATHPYGFDLDFVNNAVWEQWMYTRTPLQTRNTASGMATDQVRVPVPTSSVSDQNGGLDRPFYSFGAPAAAGGGSFAFGTGGNSDQTILRRSSDIVPPYLSLAGGNAYTQNEPMRKTIGSVTTVSHQFVVYVTIGYFEVTNPAAPGWPTGANAPPPPPQFGAEVYDKIPGDMRQKYMAVVDMSNLGLKAHPVANDPDPHAQGRPFFSALIDTARPANPTFSIAYTRHDNSNAANPVLYIASDGVETAIVGGPAGTGTQLVIGSGLDVQYVTVLAVGSVPGQITVTGLSRPAWAGTCVSNVRPGYAGPQVAFDYNSAKYKPVIPYVERLR